MCKMTKNPYSRSRVIKMHPCKLKVCKNLTRGPTQNNNKKT